MEKVEKAYRVATVANDNRAEVFHASQNITICDLCQQDIAELSPQQKDYFLSVQTENEGYNMPNVCYLATVMHAPKFGIVYCGLKNKGKL